MKENFSREEQLLYLTGGTEPPEQAPPRDRSENPYRRFYTKDRSARDLARPPAKETEEKEGMKKVLRGLLIRFLKSLLEWLEKA